MARNWISIFAHVVFGLIAAGAYMAIRDRHFRRDSIVRVSLSEKKA